jgi:hypothetical protein
MNPATFYPFRSGKDIHQTGDNGLSSFSALGIIQNQTGDCGCEFMRDDSGFTFAVGVAGLITAADSNECA